MEKSFKCKICDCNSSRKDEMKQNVLSVHEGKKPFNAIRSVTIAVQKDNLKKGSVHEMRKAFIWVVMIIPYYRKIVFPFRSHYRRHFLSKMIMIISQIYTYLLNYYRRPESCSFL